MITTSHFIWIELKAFLLSDLFIQVYQYTKEHGIEDVFTFQNPLSPHITLYYLEKDIDTNIKEEIKKEINSYDIDDSIRLNWFDYFYRWDDRFVLYFTSQTDLPLKKYRDQLHVKYNRDYVEDNGFSFSPHVTFLRIQKPKIFETHRKNIEKIISQEIAKIKSIDLNSRELHLYAVNSKFKEEIQIKI